MDSSIPKTDITMHVDSLEVALNQGLSMVDVMQYIKPDIYTINTGIASMGSILLGRNKGKKFT